MSSGGPTAIRRAYRTLVPPRVRQRVHRARVGKRFELAPAASEDRDAVHPERLAVLPYLRGSSVEIGCGHRKTTDEAIGVDLTPGGQPGTVGNVAGRISRADVTAHGSMLPFRAATFDTLIARHNLEHYVDPVAVLREWARVLAPGGVMTIIVPDEATFPGRTLDLDPTHYHAFTEMSLRSLVDLLGDFRVLETRPVVENWSFLLAAERLGEGR